MFPMVRADLIVGYVHDCSVLCCEHAKAVKDECSPIFASFKFDVRPVCDVCFKPLEYVTVLEDVEEDGTDDWEPEPERGVYIDGHWGQYGSARLVQMAHEMGWVDSVPIRLNDLSEERSSLEVAQSMLTFTGLDDPTGQIFEQILWAADDAEAWLNEHRRPEGSYWSWEDGEFGLWAEEDREED